MSNKKRRLFLLSGCVQGVGFRPFVFRLAKQYELAGHIRNTSRGVSIDVQGEIQTLNDFQRDLTEKKPARAEITEMMQRDAPLCEASDFAILSSEQSVETELALLPDTAICAECLQELYDPQDRRYLYPFLHCMSCGPRFSLFLQMPFDRKNTTMVDFPMCPHCKNEYTNPSNRRFHSQTNCCSDCGPKLQLLDAQQSPISIDPISGAAEVLKAGKILALKNTGGFLLLVDATNDRAIERLRKLKRRPKKPFALLTTDLAEAKEIAFVDQVAENLLSSPAAPIVLLKKKIHLPPSVAWDSPYYGLMLAHNALQHLLLTELKRPLIATSGNRSGMPLCIDEETAFLQLSSVADAFLIHNRRIEHRLDDSVVQIIDGSPMLIRRARGYIPYAIDISSPRSLFGAGGHMKNSFAFSIHHRIYPSQYIGDLDSQDASLAYDREVKSWKNLLHATFDHGVGDLHPGYYTSRLLREKNISANFIQHHRAHVYSGMLDNRLSFPFFSIAWDGTGFGDDGTIWGGEAFLAKEEGLEHFATLDPFPLPGSESAVKEPRRALLGMLYAIFGSSLSPLDTFSEEEFQILRRALDHKLNAPLCSSMGRMFDAISALLNCCFKSHYEGEAALTLETLAGNAATTSLSYAFEVKKTGKNFWVIIWKEVLKQMLHDKENGVDFSEMARSFHQALADLIVKLAQHASCEKVLLTGGCMQNKLLIELAITRLRAAGFEPFWHREIPSNDGGLAIGQIYGNILEDANVLSSAR